MLLHGIILFLQAHSSWEQMFQGMSCFSCTGVSKPQDCKNAMRCPKGEVCSTESYVTAQGHIAYDLKCKHKDTCSKSGYMVSSEEIGRRLNTSHGSVIGRRAPAKLLHTCEECCDSPNCNSLLCGGTPGGRLCYSCDNLASFDECTTVDTCYDHESCYVEERINDLAEVRFFGGCIPELKCEDYKAQKQVDQKAPCFSCCKDNFCNNKCRDGCCSKPERK